MNKKQFVTTSFTFHLFGVIKNTVCEITSIHQYTLETSPSVRGFRYCRFEDFKPILRPLSDLTKPITHKGKKFVPNDMLLAYYGDKIQKELPIMLNSFNLVMQLIYWHFDIAGLIERGEAIDVNTLPENPYK